MPFTINKPKLDLEEPFQVRLVTSDGDEVNMTDLSSGEKTILSLISLQFKNSLSLKFPKVLLLDEPDSVLHPSMSKKFMDVVSEFLVKEKKIKVIMTTHSPSTISFTPPEYIFVVNKEGDRIQHVSRDKALKALTVGVPSFSVNYENRRQVFVESDFDQSFYTQLYGVLSNWLDPEISLYFISSGETRVNQNGTKISNCERVIAITDMMRGYGNNFVFGIIDRDIILPLIWTAT
jgi:ABC-type multidrug transport system ATPase subunit